MTSNRKRRLIALLAVILGVGGYFAWQKLGGDNLPPGFASGNGRIEAVEIDIATKTPGRIRDILALEFGGSRDPVSVSLHRFKRMAGLVHMDADIVVNEVNETVEAILDVWPGMLPNLPASSHFGAELIERWKRLTLVQEIRHAMAADVKNDKQDEPPATMQP
ncbi:hypothetical protein [Tardiphaga sp. 42S5]|uniref:hypothetical protein n=1 Tax=Tardiphaga sp. 42S5 TaxID=1404799 RepID=UPI002A59BEA4|nr:hypothetical protein [Tardiphaga sp. 42S5]WPO42907.1 hypothetical protein SFY93_07115 [Tardiphaga sp. 42S5]